MEIYILASDFFGKDDKYIFKAIQKFVLCVGNFQPLNAYISFIRNKSDDYLYILDHLGGYNPPLAQQEGNFLGDFNSPS